MGVLAFLLGLVSATLFLMLRRRNGAWNTTHDGVLAFEMTEATGARLARVAPRTDNSNASREMVSPLYEAMAPANPGAQTILTAPQSSVLDVHQSRNLANSYQPSGHPAREGISEQIPDVQERVVRSNTSQSPSLRRNSLPVPTPVQSQVDQSIGNQALDVTNEESSANDRNSHTYGDISDIMASEAPVIDLTNNPGYGKFPGFQVTSSTYL